MPSLKETLELLVTANVGGAVAGFEKVGTAAQKNLGKTDDHLQKLGGRMQTAGAGMMAFGAVALVGLGHMAQASEDANLANLKLQNSLTNNPKLAGENTKAYFDLASALQKKTAASDDEIIAGMSMLGTFKVTGEQLRELTPLVVDYARKFGVDLVTANASVGKAMDGSIGALKRNGVTIDENLYKTDRYAAIVQALRTQVGGFAEAEGKTFSGQLTILQNQLGELEEGIGIGVVQALSGLVGGVSSAAGALDSLSPGLQAGIGQWGTYGALALTAAGAVTFVGGSALKSASSFGLLAKSTDASGKLALTAAGRYGILIGSVAGLALAFKEGLDHATTFTMELGDLGKAADHWAQAPKQEMETFIAMAKGAGTSLYDLGRQMSDESIPTALAFADGLDRVGIASADVRRAVDDKKSALVGASEAQKEAAAAAEGTTTAEEGQTAATEDLKKATEELERAQQSLVDNTIGAMEAGLRYSDAQIRTREAVAELTKAQRDHSLTADELTSKMNDARDAAIGQAEAVVTLAEKHAAATGATLTAKESQAILVAELTNVMNSLAPGSALRVFLQEYIDQLNSIPDSRMTVVGMTVSGTTHVGTGQSEIRKVGSFDKGGLVPGPRGKAQVAVVHGGEYVVKADDVNTAGSSGGASGGTTVVQLVIGQKVIDEIMLDGLASNARRNGNALARSISRG